MKLPIASLSIIPLPLYQKKNSKKKKTLNPEYLIILTPLLNSAEVISQSTIIIVTINIIFFENKWSQNPTSTFYSISHQLMLEFISTTKKSTTKRLFLNYRKLEYFNFF